MTNGFGRFSHVCTWVIEYIIFDDSDFVLENNVSLSSCPCEEKWLIRYTKKFEKREKSILKQKIMEDSRKKLMFKVRDEYSWLIMTHIYLSSIRASFLAKKFSALVKVPNKHLKIKTLRRLSKITSKTSIFTRNQLHFESKIRVTWNHSSKDNSYWWNISWKNIGYA